MLTFVFCRVPLAALLRMAWGEILGKALALVQMRGGSVALGGGGWMWKGSHCLFSI